MLGFEAGVTSYSYVLAVMLHAGFAVYVVVSPRLRNEGGALRWPLVGALLVTAGWAAVALTAEVAPSALAHVAAAGLDILRYALWFVFLLLLIRPSAGSAGERSPNKRSPGRPQTLTLFAAGCVLAATAMLWWRFELRQTDVTASRATLATLLALPLCGLILVEQLFRNLGPESRWSAKPVCLGLACIFAFDTYLYSEALLFSRIDRDAISVRAAAHLLAVPFLFVATSRRADWIARLQVSRTAAFYSATLLLAGLYLLFMSAIGYYVRYFGGNWGRALEVSLLFAGLTLLGGLIVSGSFRSWLRVFVGKHFFSYRYDYRQEWLRFTATLSTKGSPEEVSTLIVRALANLVECPAGSLWACAMPESAFTQAARWNMARIDDTEAFDSPFSHFLRSKAWVIDLDEFRASPRRYGGLALPIWLLGSVDSWVVVPLLAGDDLLGFVVLARPRTPVQLNWEVLDLLKTASRQAAGYLAQMQATEALLEARKFDAFNRMSAFVVHDLKNIITQLSLMLKNAQRLQDNREFQQDMLLTVESSLEKMRRMMLQLREGATPPGGSRGVELMPIVRRLEALATAQGRTLQTGALERLATRGHEDRLERVLGHLVQNAFDATPADGRVWVSVERYSGQVRVEIGDTGAGMTEEFVRSRLFRPFNTTKRSGMGIGSYESAQYIRELGGSLGVHSAPQQGTTVTVLIPLFDAQTGSDLLTGTRH